MIPCGHGNSQRWASGMPVFTEVTFDEFYTHYQSTWQAVKSVDPLLQFGGPGGFASIVWAADILPDFFRFAEDHGCFPDFITTQDYPHQNVEDDIEFMNTSISQDFLPTTLSGDRHFTRNLCTRLCQLMRAVDREHTPIWLEECNSTIWQRDLSGDTCYKAAWLCHSIAGELRLCGSIRILASDGFHSRNAVPSTAFSTVDTGCSPSMESQRQDGRL
ncbi:MAG: GH39 family glycosyl hydrolase [Butyricicoccaceae bacterium]